MPDVHQEGGRIVEHVHEPCIECGVAEAIIDGLCEECTTGNPVTADEESPR